MSLSSFKLKSLEKIVKPKLRCHNIVIVCMCIHLLMYMLITIKSIEYSVYYAIK